jgi:hypothetical protein
LVQIMEIDRRPVSVCGPGREAAMKIRLGLIAALAVFDLAIAVLTSLSLLPPQIAVGLLLTNPLAVIVDHRLRARRAAIGVRADRR